MSKPGRRILFQPFVLNVDIWLLIEISEIYSQNSSVLFLTFYLKVNPDYKKERNKTLDCNGLCQIPMTGGHSDALVWVIDINQRCIYSDMALISMPVLL